MKVGKFLVVPAVEDEPVGCQVIFSDQALHRRDKISQEGIAGFQVSEGTNGFPGKDDHMEWISWLRVRKSQQGIGLTQAFEGDGKGRMVQHPDKYPVESSPSQQTVDTTFPQR